MATKLVKVQPVDNQALVIRWQDGYVEYNWDDSTSGSCNGWDYLYTEKWSRCQDKDQYVPYGKPLALDLAQLAGSFLIHSRLDPNYGTRGRQPLQVYRKSKVWEASHDERMPAMHHWIYLELPTALQRGTTYTLNIDPTTNTDQQMIEFTFDELLLESPAIKIANTGYEQDAVHKSADVYLWMGDGGERDFSRFTGKPWHLYEVKSGKKMYSGTLQFRMKNKPEPEYQQDFTMADVWECDFSEFRKTGHYKLVIEGIGSSAAFTIEENIFEEPFKVAMQGMFYQRVGCEASPAGNFPRARLPLFKQGVDPVDFTVYISNKNMVTGTNPDNRGFYSKDLSGEIARATWGGWVDAYDLDQRPVNFVVVFDLLLAYHLTPGAFQDSQLYLPETGNQVPDILDEALWEIDWWLRMRDSKGGYLTGLTNIHPPENVNYAGAPCGWQGWCVAAGSAMAADAFRIAGRPDLQKKYLDSALVAYRWAEDQPDPMLEVDVSGLRGKDLKMTAAAYLYNLTGDNRYEQLIEEICELNKGGEKIRQMGEWEQQYAALAYLNTPRKVNYPQLQEKMKTSIMAQAREDYVDKMADSPTKAARWAPGWEGMMQTSNEMSLVVMAHHLSKDTREKAYFEKGMYAEAEWTLGRNPLGLVQMTGLGERSITQTFAPGRRDGYQGITPGWTPFMCRDGWNNGDDIHRCAWYTNRNYPANKEIWPYGEHFWNSRYSVPNSESTPQQNFRQKIVLYGYLYGMSK